MDYKEFYKQCNKFKDPKHSWVEVISEALGIDSTGPSVTDGNLSNLLDNATLEKKSLNHEWLANVLQKTFSILNIDGELYIYNYEVGYYTQEDIEPVIRWFVNFKKEDSWRSSLGEELKKALLLDLTRYTIKDMNQQYLSFREHDLNLQTLELVEHSPEHRTTFGLPSEPVDAPTPHFVKFILSTFNDDFDTIDALLFYASRLFLINEEAKKMVWLISSGASGKSTFLTVLRNVVGSGNTTNQGLENIGSDFGLAPLVGKLAWILDEGSDKSFSAVRLKQLATGDTLTVNRKFLEHIDVKLTPKIFLSFNKLPVPEDTIGFERRLVLVRFPNTYRGESIDTTLDKNLESETDAIAGLLLEYLRLLRNGFNGNVDSVTSEAIEDETQKYLAQSQPPVYRFLKENGQLRNGERIENKKLFTIYTSFIQKENIDPRGTQDIRSFMKEVRAHYKAVFGRQPTMKKSNGKTYLCDFGIK